MVFFGLNIAESLSTRGSGTSTTALWTSKRPAEAVVGVLPRVNALKMVVFPDWGNPMIPSFILTLVLGVVYFGAQLGRSGGIGRRARLKIVFPPGMRVRFPPSALPIIPCWVV